MKTKTEELVETTLIIGAMRADFNLKRDTALPLVSQHIKSMSKKFDKLFSDELKWKMYSELCGWKEHYNMNFQMYNGDFNIYLSKNDIEVYSTGGHRTPEEAIEETLAWIYKVNRLDEDYQTI